MQTLYSSTFLTAILAFLMLLGQSGNSVSVVQGEGSYSFASIIEPIGPQPLQSGMVKVEAFNTFGCRDCDHFGLYTLPDVFEKYAEDEHVDFHLYMMPDLDKEGELYAVRGAHCAATYDRFWEMVNELHKAEALSRREVDLIGQDLGLPIVPFRNCIDSEDFDAHISKDLEYARARGVTEKPTIMVNGTMLLGDQPVENIEKFVDQYLTQ